MRKYLILMALALGAPAVAQPADEVITVLANGAPQAVERTGQPVSVFTREDIEQVQGPDLTRLLERAPGVTLSRNGGPGAFTAVRVRGAEGEQLLVLIDGVPVADPAAPGGGFDFGNLLLGSLAQVELLRSANSTIWGSQALGGVLAVTTGAADGLSASAEYGSYDTFYSTAAAGLTAGPAILAVQGAHYTSDGFSAAAAGAEPDGFRQSELAARARIELAPGWSAFATGRYAAGRLQLDGFLAPAFTLADTAEYQDTRQLSGALGLDYAAPTLDLQATFASAATERDNFDPATGVEPTFTTEGVSQRAELRGRWRFRPALALHVGATHDAQSFTSLTEPERRTATTGAYAQLAFDRGPLHLAAGARRDEHRDFGGQWSLGADAAYALSDRWRLTTSIGEGFKAPTLFQLHSDYGNAALRPERSRSFDLGLGFRRGTARAALALFRRDTQDLIGFVSCFGTTEGLCANRPFGTYDNVGRARAQGVELEAALRPAAALGLTAAYTYLEATDRTPGAPENDLARRPRHALTLSGDWQPPTPLTLGADLRLVSDSFDDPANTVPLAGHAVLTLRGEWQASRAVILYARLENAGDEDYQTAAGFGTARRSAYFGARGRW